MIDLSEEIERKFIDTIDISDFEILTESGYVDIKQIHKTIPYIVYRITLENGYSLDCADTHIVIDSDFNQIYAKDSLDSYLATDKGAYKVVSVECLGYEESMYDISVDSDNHTFYSNGILSHNTTTAAIIILHYALFNDAKRIAILANKEAAAIEVLDRIQLSFENLPLWQQRGVIEWNKKSVTFENKSRIIAAATSSDSIRGKACSMIYIDECIRKLTLLYLKLNELEFTSTVEDFYNQLNDEIEYDNLLIKPNYDYEILSSNGYVKFKGIKKTKTDYYIRISFSDNSILECTDSHSIKNGDEFIYINDLKVGDFINDLQIINIEDISCDEYVYDVLDVENNEYRTNNVISHNCAFIDNWSDFWASTYPTISSGKTTKMFFTSTPNSINHYYDFWKGATDGTTDEFGVNTKNGYIPVFAPYYKVPGRDEKWKQETLEALNFDEDKFRQEYLGEFMGSSTTLLPGSVLKKLSVHEPVQRNEYIKQYDLPVYNKSTPDNNHIYFMVCDVSRGKGLDYSTFSIFDISTVPYVQVCTYRCNTTTPTDFATIIFNMGKLYNEAYVMIELNDLGEQVATILKYDLDYDNVICMQSAGRAGKRISSGFGKGIEYGIRTTTAVKRLGCSMTKLLLEQNKLVLKDLVTIKEFATFAKDSKESYSAQAGFHDDMVMTVILFAFITQDPFFIGFTDINVMNLLRDQTNSEIEEDLMPFGVVNNPLDSLEPVYIKFAGESGVWTESSSGGDIW